MKLEDMTCLSNYKPRAVQSMDSLNCVLFNSSGTSPGQFTRELMDNCQKLISCNSLGPEIDPVEVLGRSLMETQSIGASTALLAFFVNQVLMFFDLQLFLLSSLEVLFCLI